MAGKMNWDRVRSENSYIKYRDQETIYVNDRRFDAGDGEMLNDKDYSKWSYSKGSGSKKHRKKKKTTKTAAPKKTDSGPLNISIKSEVFLLIEVDRTTIDTIRKAVKKEGKYDYVTRIYKKETVKRDEFSQIRMVLFKEETDYYRVLINRTEDLELLFSGICVTCRNIEEVSPQLQGLSKYRISYESNGSYSAVKIYVKGTVQQEKNTTRVPGQEKNKHNPIKKGRQQNDSWKIPANNTAQNKNTEKTIVSDPGSGNSDKNSDDKAYKSSSPAKISDSKEKRQAENSSKKEVTVLKKKNENVTTLLLVLIASEYLQSIISTLREKGNAVIAGKFDLSNNDVFV